MRALGVTILVAAAIIGIWGYAALTAKPDYDGTGSGFGAIALLAAAVVAVIGSGLVWTSRHRRRE